MKICKLCWVEKETTSFYFHKKHKDGLNSYCIDCTKRKANNWYADNKENAKGRDHLSHIKRTYGLSPDQYQSLLDRQNGCCVVCRRHQDELKHRLSVDHCHHTGAIRGLLCTNCNHRLIGSHKNGDELRRMADYVESQTEFFMPSVAKESP